MSNEDIDTIDALFSAGAASQVKAVINLNGRIDEIEDILEGSPMTLDNEEFRRRVKKEVLQVDLSDAIGLEFDTLESDVRSTCVEEIENTVDSYFILNASGDGVYEYVRDELEGNLHYGEKISTLEDEMVGLEHQMSEVVGVMSALYEALALVHAPNPTFKERRDKGVGEMLDRLTEDGQIQVMSFIKGRAAHEEALAKAANKEGMDNG